MTAPPQIITRALTFNFAQTVSASTGLPDILDISVLPLGSATDAQAGATFAGGLRTTQLELTSEVNSWTVNLIPSNSPGLTAPINYRVLWRTGVMGATTTYDFAMVDQDITFDDLMATTGNIINGSVYLQQTDLGVPGRVARLNDAGEVIDSNGIPVASSTAITAVTNLITAESTTRAAAVNALNTSLQTMLTTQVAAAITSGQNYTNIQTGILNTDITAERGARQSADADLQSQITANQTDATNDDATLTTAVAAINTALPTKADLVNGQLSVDQIPDELVLGVFTVADQNAMLALTYPTVHKGDLAVRPDGVFLLSTDDPSHLANWVALSVVSSVNGQRGVVTLSAANVGAIPVGGAITQSQVTGLTTALSNKANQTDLTTTQTALAAIQNDTTIVRTSSSATPANTIPSSKLDANMVYLNSSGQLTKKDGTIIATGGGGGGAVGSVNGQTGIVVLTAANVGAIALGASITQSQVTGLSTALTNKADLSSGAVPIGQLPTNIPQSSIAGLTSALAAKADLSGGVLATGEIPSVPQSSVTGLSTLVSGNQLTGSTNAINRIAALEAEVVTLGGGGGGTGVATQAEFWTSSNTTTEQTASDFSTVVNLHSPWGIDSDGTITGTTGTWYYLYTGVRSVDVAFASITPNGHLSLRAWNESGAADPTYALASDVSTLTTTVSGKASQSDLTALTTTVSGKANQSDLTALSTTVDGKANQTDLDTTNATVATKADASALATTNATVATKANQSDLTTLTTTVGTKAAQSDMTTVQGNITTINSTLTTKADLVSGLLKTSQIPAIPQSAVTNLVTNLAAKADLVSGTVPLSEIPTNIAQSSISGLGTALGNKADLVSGLVPVSQIPPQALTAVQQVTSQAAMLALTTSQVQIGDFCLITTGSNLGTYILIGSDPSQLSNWALLPGGGAGTITSVNGYTGPTVTLTATDVGALGSGASIPQSQVTGLTTALATFATTSALTSGLAGKTAFSDVQSMISASSLTKRADYVATGAIASLSGLQSIDGILVSSGALVLATAQSSSVNNGLWVASSGTWARAADFSTGSYLAKDTLVFVTNQTGGSPGTTKNNSIYQMQAASGFIDTAANNWTQIGWTAAPFGPVAGNGISITGSTFAAVTQSGGGLTNGSSGLARDPNLTAGKFLGTVPSGATVAGITHNLNTTSPVVSIYDTASGNQVLAGVTVTSANAISIEFASAPTTGQYRVCVLG